MKKIAFVLLFASSLNVFAYQEIEVQYEKEGNKDQYFVLEVKKIGENNDVLYKHVRNYMGTSNTYVRTEINCKNKTLRLLGSSGISAEKIDLNSEDRKFIPQAYDWQDINVGPSGQVALANFVCTPPLIEKPTALPKISEEKRNALQNCLTLQSGEAIAKCLNKK